MRHRERRLRDPPALARITREVQPREREIHRSDRAHGDDPGGDYDRWLDARDPKARALLGTKNGLPHNYTVPQANRTAIPEELYATAFLGERACGHAADRLARRGTPATLDEAQAVARIPGEVGVRGAVDVLHLRVGLGPGVHVADEQSDRAPERPPFEDAREDLDAVGLLARRG